MGDEGQQRRLSAILAADVAGYTRLVEQDTDGTVAAWQAARTDIIDPTIAGHLGRLVKLTGDGFLAEFTTVQDAVKCAIAMQSDLSASPLDFRMGVNLGDVIDDGEDIHGEGVNIAARLEGLAEPGGICISGSVYEQVRNRLDHDFEDMGEHEVKHVSAPVQVWRVGLAGAGAGPAPAASGPALPDKPSIAVLPFPNMSGDPEQEYFADGVADNILTALSNVHSFLVIARNSSFTYKGQAVDVKTVSRELGVRYILEGSVRKAANRVRVSAQLVEATTANQIWADRYEGTLDDIFDLQDQITASVVGAIEPKLLRAEVDRIKQKRSGSLDAYDYTLRGLYQMDQLTFDDTAEALRLFKKTTEIDPNYGRAHVCASWCYRRQAQIRGMVLTADERSEGLRLAETALRTDPTDPYILWQVGLTLALLKGDLERGIDLIERSLKINSNSTRGWLSSAMVHNFLGQPDIAIAEANRAVRLSPLEMATWVAMASWRSPTFNSPTTRPRHAGPGNRWRNIPPIFRPITPSPPVWPSLGDYTTPESGCSVFSNSMRI